MMWIMTNNTIHNEEMKVSIKAYGFLLMVFAALLDVEKRRCP